MEATAMKVLSFFLISLCCSCIALASDECEATLKATDSYKELNDVLNCLNSRIDQLEANPSPKARTSNPSFENSFIKVFINVVGSGKNRITLSLTLENKLNQDIYLAFDRSHSRPTLLDSNGGYYSSDKESGLPIIYGSQLSSKNNYSKLSAGSKAPINIVFDTRKELKPSDLSFSSQMVRFIDNTPERFSMGVASLYIK
jgi:hypothetical protein